MDAEVPESLKWPKLDAPITQDQGALLRVPKKFLMHTDGT